VVGVVGKGFSETIDLFEPHVIREVVHTAATILDRPRSGFARFFQHGETLSAQQVVTVMPKSMAQYVANWRDFRTEALVMIETWSGNRPSRRFCTGPRNSNR
jgi:hypothetical protein